MSVSPPALALRASDGVFLCPGPPDVSKSSEFLISSSDNCRCMGFSPDGQKFFSSSPDSLIIYGVKDNRVLGQIPIKDVFSAFISPRSDFLACWQRFVVNKEFPNGFQNLTIWSLEDFTQRSAWVHKNSSSWKPVWSEDQALCARCVSDEIQFLSGETLTGGILSRLKSENIGSVCFSPGKAPYKLSVFSNGPKGQPSSVKIYNYTDLKTPTASKCFFNADRVEMMWNSTGTSLLVISHTDRDRTGKSYYGETHLYFMAANGSLDCLVPLNKEGPVYDVSWSPNGKEFIAVYGYMPSKATLFDGKCNPLFDFGSASRNVVRYSPRGNIIWFAGFGNCNGKMEFWDHKNFKLISRVTMENTTQWSWCPDNEHVFVATTSPRLRVDNGLKVIHYSGKLVAEIPVKELWEVSWQSLPTENFPKKPLVAGIVDPKEGKTEAPVAAYRPPGARSTPPLFSFNKGENDGPQKLNVKRNDVTGPVKKLPPGVAPETLSKSQIKNLKKKEAARAKAVLQDQKAASLMAETSNLVVESTSEEPTEAELEKRVKALMKKLRQISILQDRSENGESLNPEELEKIESKDGVNQEIEEIQKKLSLF